MDRGIEVQVDRRQRIGGHSCNAKSMGWFGNTEGQENVDIADLAAMMAESLVDLIFLAPEEDHGKLLAATIAHLGHAFLGKSGEGESNMTH